jgi:hypothetical protein
MWPGTKQYVDGQYNDDVCEDTEELGHEIQMIDL